jgi:hypothetical protein
MQIFNHTHMVFGSISCVQRLKPFAGEIQTLGAKPHLAFPDFLALVFHEQTMFPPWNTTGTIAPVKPFFVDVVLHSLITAAQGAIHAARGNQFLFHINLWIS